MNDEFYIGWERKAAPGIGRTVRKTVICLSAFVLVAPLIFAMSQRLIGTSVFEWGKVKTVSGILQIEPYPHLLVPRPGSVGNNGGFSTYHLVAPWKFGLDAEAIAPLNGKSVSIKGTLIYRDNQTMMETKPDWIVATNNLPRIEPAPFVALGKQTFVGEILDSKCFLGVMNPGQLTPHRACAIRCISGGAPPILLVRRKDGAPVYLLLVSAAGKPVNREVLDMVAEPVEITGEVERQGDLLVLHSDPQSYHRVK
jgi:hypothetical protein